MSGEILHQVTPNGFIIDVGVPKPNLTAEDLTPVKRQVRNSAAIVAGRARQFAPRGKTGNLIKGIVPRGPQERSRSPLKVVYDVWIDPDMNSTFVKYSKAGKRYYYPASMEHGFRTRATKYSVDKIDRVPGHYYMLRARNAVHTSHQTRVLAAATTVIKNNLNWGD